MNDDKPASAAGKTQGVAFSLGKGRVVVMGEAAELSAQVFGQDGKMGMNVPGIDNRQMALNIMHWLRRLLSARGSTAQKGGVRTRNLQDSSSSSAARSVISAKTRSPWHRRAARVHPFP